MCTCACSVCVHVCLSRTRAPFPNSACLSLSLFHSLACFPSVTKALPLSLSLTHCSHPVTTSWVCVQSQCNRSPLAFIILLLRPSLPSPSPLTPPPQPQAPRASLSLALILFLISSRAPSSAPAATADHAVNEALRPICTSPPLAFASISRKET